MFGLKSAVVESLSTKQDGSNKSIKDASQIACNSGQIGQNKIADGMHKITDCSLHLTALKQLALQAVCTQHIAGARQSAHSRLDSGTSPSQKSEMSW